jgi:hypothetical protein
MDFKTKTEIELEAVRRVKLEGRIETLVSVAKELLKSGVPRGIILSAARMDDEWLKEVEKSLN